MNRNAGKKDAKIVIFDTHNGGLCYSNVIKVEPIDLQRGKIINTPQHENREALN